MSQQDFGEQKKDRRQSQTKREYGCPCGKTYLSYPALFTHVKQKHDGKPPGQLIKPKTQKARGRPKIHTDAPEDDMSDGAFNFQEELESAIGDLSVAYSESVKLSEGTRTCQDMVTSFLNKIPFLKHEQKKVMNCFINQLRYFVDKKYGDKFWVSQKPNEIIDLANEMCIGHEQVQKRFPIPREALQQILYVFFRWMYKWKWTDHKLIKRAPLKVI